MARKKKSKSSKTPSASGFNKKTCKNAVKKKDMKSDVDDYTAGNEKTSAESNVMDKMFKSEREEMNIQKNTELLKVEKKLNEALKAIQNLTTTVSELETKNGILSQKVVDQDIKHNDEFRKVEKVHEKETKSLRNKIDNLERLNRLLLAKNKESQDRAEKSRQELRILKRR